MANSDLSQKISEYNASVLMRIRQICVERSTSITKIEKALGYGNGTVSGWKNAKKKAPYDRIVAIADFLNVPVSQLTGKEEKPALDNENEPLTVDEIKESFRGRPMSELLELMSSLTEELKNSGTV